MKLTSRCLRRCCQGERFSLGAGEPRARFATGFGDTERGIALVIVMISIFVLTMLAGGFALSMKVETKLARNANSEMELEWLGRSAVECARWEMAQYPFNGLYISLDQPWAGGTSLVGISNGPLADFYARDGGGHRIQTKNGEANWTIMDLERKANINDPRIVNDVNLQQKLIEVMGVDPGSVTPVVNSILDWTDANDRPNSHRVQGARTDYYQSLTPPYVAKMGPIDDLSEMLLIKGVTPEIFFGFSSTNYQPGAFNATSRRFSPQTMVGPVVGLTNLFTPLSRGNININTASAEVLQLLPGVDADIAKAIVEGRNGEDDGLGNFGPYRNVGQLSTRLPQLSQVNPLFRTQGAQGLAAYCDVYSHTFEVHVDAQAGGYHRQFVGVIGRDPRNLKDFQVLSFYWTGFADDTARGAGSPR